MLPFRDYNPSRTFPLVTIAIIVANVLVFLYMIGLYSEGPTVLNSFVMRASVIPAVITGEAPVGNQLQPVWMTIFTAMFMHGGPVHLFGNMLYLWIFGNNVEDIMGSGRFLAFYLICGILATVTHIAIDPNSAIPSLGASGAIAGVLGAYLVRFPRAQVDTCVFFIFVTIIRLPALIVLAFWFVLQLFSGVAAVAHGSNNQGGVAFWAHIGGFLAGMILVNVFAKRQRTRMTF